MKITNQEIVNLYQGLQLVASLTGAKFAYAIARNTEILEKELKSLRIAGRPSDEYMKYEEARGELAESHARKDKDGQPEKYKKDGLERFSIEDNAKFEADFTALRLEYKDVIISHKKQQKEFDELLLEETTVELYMIPKSYLPENINTKQMVGILPIVKKE